ncbi:ABC transporter ATP-binding protein [Cerasicoccus arenae]|uniref:ABC transporter ATP-binding protein n=1 Tax=Cerasicoccus arenae TaxID=424488 RepID=A0A8J3GD51_9BACT|nr:ATP-binding cassette domain-containing protein [Cerasicoccus arenae]MBK1859448.1 ATP-binding cassette domain-containing protein [Cerasicoccus arenae]GHB94197.1 ABC transporter ATP-binding protein [Cerasicoccus arenae]
MPEKNIQSIGVEIEHLSKRFGEQVVLDDVSFSVKPGEIFVLMGPSGAGKSVLLRHLVNLEKPDAGRVLIGGKDADDDATHSAIRTALVFQAGALFNSMSVFDNLAFYPREHRLYDKATLRDKVEHVLKILHIEDAARKLPAQLSGGMRKRVAIARSLVMEPQLLLYDEPTSELDPITAANISEIIGTLKEEFAVTSIIVSHDRDLALGIADRVGLLMAGKLLTVATPDELRASTEPAITEFMRPKIDVHNPRFRRLA